MSSAGKLLPFVKLFFEIIIKISFVILGMVLIVYSLNVFKLWGRFDFFVFLSGVLGLLIIILTITFDKIIKIAIKLPKFVKVFGIALLFIGASSFVIVQGIIISNMRGKASLASNETEYVIVLGCQVVGSLASVPLIRRVYTAIEYLNNHPDVKVVISGGQGPGEDITEAEAMRRLLAEKGIASDRILIEDRSRNTVQNFRHADDLYDLKNKNIVVVTTDYHMFRSLGVARKQGYQNVSGLASRSQITVLPIYLFREYFAVVFYALTGRI